MTKMLEHAQQRLTADKGNAAVIGRRGCSMPFLAPIHVESDPEPDSRHKESLA